MNSPTKESNMTDSVILDTTDGINFFRLCQLRGALKMEARGMMHSRMGKIRKPVALSLGMKANTKIEEVIAEVQKRIDNAIKEKEEAALAA